MLRYLGAGLLAVATGMAARGAPPAEVVDVAAAGLPVLELRVQRRAAVSAYRDAFSTRGHLTSGRRARVQRWAGDWLYVAADTAVGPVEGWVPAAALEPVPESWRAAVRDRLAQQHRHQQLIAEHEVTPGMTAAELRASLGDPRRREPVPGEPVATEDWVYVEDRYLPWYRQEIGADGEVAQSITYRRVPHRERRIRLRGGVVAAVGEPVAVAP